jgi:hypothetical protein
MAVRRPKQGSTTEQRRIKEGSKNGQITAAEMTPPPLQTITHPLTFPALLVMKVESWMTREPLFM